MIKVGSNIILLQVAPHNQAVVLAIHRTQRSAGGQRDGWFTGSINYAPVSAMGNIDTFHAVNIMSIVVVEFNCIARF